MSSPSEALFDPEQIERASRDHDPLYVAFLANGAIGSPSRRFSLELTEGAEAYEPPPRARPANRASSIPTRDVVLPSGDDHVAGPASVRASTPAVGSGRELEWPQLGIGSGVGILLSAGLWLAMRMPRPPARPADPGHLTRPEAAATATGRRSQLFLGTFRGS